MKVRAKTDRYLKGCPQVAGTVISVLKLNPKKPNSANRSAVRVQLSNGEITKAAIPGEKHSIQVHARVLLRGGNRKDTIGIKHVVVLGAKGFDARGVKDRKSSRSKYGVPAS